MKASGWFPYVQVDDLGAATEKAIKLGATALQPATEGPAGTYTPILEPGGAVFPLLPAETVSSATGSRLQGRDDVVIDAPPDLLWSLIADPHELPSWGPPVKSVEVMTEGGQAETLGTPRKVHAEFGPKSGYFPGHRVEHVPGRKIADLIDEESFGPSRVLSRPGFSLDLEPLGVKPPESPSRSSMLPEGRQDG